MSKPYIKVDFDPSYTGGKYTGTPNQVLISQEQAFVEGVANAFEKITGHPADHIVQTHVNFDDLVNADGTPWKPVVDLVAEQEQVIQLPVEEQIELPATEDIEKPVDESIQA